MQFNLANSRGQTLCSSDFSLSDIHLEGGSRAKVYLFSKFKTPSPARSEASSDLPDPELDTDFPVLPSEFLDFPSAVSNLPGPSHNQPSQSGTPTIAFKESQNRDTSCSICADRERENFFVPCGHSVCKQCAERILQEHEDCPFCKKH
ncbi:LON peptidase N-terminal domain and RING finger protein 2-like isoform X1 [Apostichopus japonicus]|uniref:LON peptidase N-terminal domain and RING finger protein 2-like isoform X1 n=1 Tax=Stichopus japonicus TaxID=307972 RepID=UPI003AB401CD